MTTSLFIRTYRGDRDWFRYAMRSLRKFASGFEEIVVVMPSEDSIHFSSLDTDGARVEYCDNDRCRGYIAQQITKLYADFYTDSDLIVFTDSDTIATAPITPETWTHEGKPIQLYRDWDKVGSAICWKSTTESVIGIAPQYEHMACMPLIYHRDTLRVTRELIERRFGCHPGRWLEGVSDWSEFNSFGAAAFKVHPELYEWRVADPGSDGYPRIMKQYFSHDGVPHHCAEMERILA